MSFRAALAITAFTLAAFVVSCRICSADDGAALAREGPPSSPSAVTASAFPQPAGWPRVQAATLSGERVGPGVRYERWLLTTDAGPLVLSLATVDVRNPNVSLAIATHNEVIIGKGERLSSMADRLGAELGINADYFDINESGSPLNVVAVDQRVLHQPDRAATFVVDGEGAVHMGPMSWHARIAGASGAVRDMTLVNEWSASVDLALITPQLGTDDAAGASEMVLAPNGTSGTYQVERIDANLARFDTLAPGQLGVAARGAQAESLARDFHPGDSVTLAAQSDPDFPGMKLGIGGGPLLVKDGHPADDTAAPAPEETNVRNPVTGAGLSGDGATLWLVVVDGRRPDFSIGLTRPQFASLFIALGAKMAMAFDSGGSSEMVIRHLGEPATSVANAPSDGRERSIADGLFVVNTATPGPIAAVILRAPAAQVLVGSKLWLEARAVDANDRPIPVRAQDVAYTAGPAAVARIDRDGTLTALASGIVQVSAVVNGAQAAAAVRVVDAIDTLRVLPANPSVAASAKLQLAIEARTRDGASIAVDPSSVQWSTDGNGGRVLSDGAFEASAAPAKTLVTARVGGASASATVLSGDHAVTLQAVPRPGMLGSAWRYTSRPAQMPGGVDASAAPDGAASLRLAYDFSNSQGTRAAYAETEMTLPGQPLALSIDVYGDANNAWLRGGYRNADGNNESMTIARHVDWRGWRTLRVSIPPQAAWPIVWTRFYVVERSKAAQEQGSLWFRNFKIIFAGP